MKELVEHLAKALVDHPDQVEVKKIEADRSVVLELRVHPDDMRLVIGRKGRIARAIRSLVKASANPEGKRTIVEILD